MRGSQVIGSNVSPQLFIGSLETSGTSATDIYNDVMSTGWLQENTDIIGGIYYGHEDAKGIEDMRLVSDFIHSRGKELIWIPYYTGDLDVLTDKIDNVDSYNNPLFDVAVVQSNSFYGASVDKIEAIFGWVSENNGRLANGTRIGLEMEYDMGLVTGRKDDPNTALQKRQILNAYLAKLDALQAMGTPIIVYSGGPNEQGYNDIRFNRNTHNSGNHIPYWEGIDESAYAYGVHYSDFPDRYLDSNPIYDLNDYIYNGKWNPTLSSSMWLDNPKK